MTKATEAQKLVADQVVRDLIDELEEKLAYLKAGVEKDGSTTAVSSSD